MGMVSARSATLGLGEAGPWFRRGRTEEQIASAPIRPEIPCSFRSNYAPVSAELDFHDPICRFAGG